MENPGVLVDILNGLKRNVQIASYLAQSRKSVSSSSIDEEFHSSIHCPDILLDGAVSADLSGSRQVITEFADVVIDKIRNRERIYANFHPNLDQIIEKKSACCDRISKLKEEMEEVERSFEEERNCRLHVIKHVEFRIERVKAKTTEALRLARECGQAAERELLKNSEKPITDRRLNVQMYQTRFASLCRENAVIEEQLNKCQLDLKSEIELLTQKLKNDTRARLCCSEDLAKQIVEREDQLNTLQAELNEVTEVYDQIIEKRKQEEEEKRRLQEIRIRRERAAIKIQRWYRVHYLRRMGRRRRKKTKSKQPSGLKFQVQTTSKEDVRKISEPKRITEILEGTSSPAMSTVSSDAPTPLPDEKPQATNPSGGGRRSVTSPIKRITVQAAAAGSIIKEESVEDQLADLPGTVSRSAQTDNRVPKSKRLYRQLSQYS